SKRSMSLRRSYDGVELARKLALYCCPGEGLTYPFGRGSRLRIAAPVGSIMFLGTMLTGKGAPVCGFRMGMIWPAAFFVFEKSPSRSAAVGSLVWRLTVGWAIWVNSWEMKKNSRRFSVFHLCGMYTGPPKLYPAIM